MKVYVATSWRNKHLDDTLAALRAEGLEPFDFRTNGFKWSKVVEPESLPLKTAGAYNTVTRSPACIDAFNIDRGELESSDGLLLLLPSGRSAHVEFGWACGRGIPAVIVSPEPIADLELMHMFSRPMFDSIPRAVEALSTLMQIKASRVKR